MQHLPGSVIGCCAALLLLISFSAPLLAVAVGGNFPIDQALDLKPNVVTVTLEAIKPRTGIWAVAPTLVFRVNQTLRVEDTDFRSFLMNNNDRIVIDRQNFIWPTCLSALSEGQFAIVILRRNPPGPPGTNWPPYQLFDVIPTSTQHFRPNQALYPIRRLIRADLLRQLKSERSSTRQLALLRFVFPLLSTHDAGVITPFLQHTDPEHRRAAHALLVALTLDPAYIPDVERDLQWVAAHSSSVRAGRTKTLDSECSMPAGFGDYAYAARFTPYMDRMFPSDAERLAKQRLLPLFRWICRNIVDPQMRWELGIQPLSQFGTHDDLALLKAEAKKDGEHDLTPFIFRIRTGRLPYDAFNSLRVLEETPFSVTIEVGYTYSGDMGDNGVWIECRPSDHNNEGNHRSAFAPASTGEHAARIRLEMAPEEPAAYTTDLLFLNFVTSRKETCCGGWAMEFTKKWSRSTR